MIVSRVREFNRVWGISAFMFWLAYLAAMHMKSQFPQAWWAHNSREINQIDTFAQVLKFLDVSIILHQNGQLETDIFYKETNSHDYLNYFSHHPQHTKQNIPYNLAKRIIVFVSDEEKMNERLSELKTRLLSYNYPLAIIDKAFLTLDCRDLHLKKKR